MAKKKSRKLEAAVEAFGELPPEVLALGKPLSVHPLGSLGKAISPAKLQLGLYALATFLFLVALGCAGMCLAGQPLGNATPDVWLAISLPSMVFCLLSGWFGWAAGRPGSDGTDRNTIRGLLIYPDAIVRATDSGFEAIRWDEATELHAPASKSNWTVVAADGRQICLSELMSDSSTAIFNILKCADAVMLPKMLATLEAGKKVMFGTFGVSRRFVYSKEDKVAWDDVTGLKLVVGQLQVSRGKLFPWCTCILLAQPNGQLAYEVIRRLAPPRLLVAADPGRPEW